MATQLVPKIYKLLTLLADMGFVATSSPIDQGTYWEWPCQYGATPAEVVVWYNNSQRRDLYACVYAVSGPYRSKYVAGAQWDGTNWLKADCQIAEWLFAAEKR